MVALMGDWHRLFHYFECATDADARRVYAALGNASSYSWADPERWGLRFGFLGNGGRLLQAETVSKYGFDAGLGTFAIAQVPKVHLVQACGPYELWSQSGPAGQLDFTWNYLCAPRAPLLPLEEAAQRSGLTAQVRRTNQVQILCLAAPLALPAPAMKWESLYCEPDRPADPLARLLEALCLCAQDLDGGPMDLFLGLRTGAHGYVQLASLALKIDQETDWPGWATLACDGKWNPLKEEVRAGPYGYSIHLGSSSATVELTSDWPYDAVPET